MEQISTQVDWTAEPHRSELRRATACLLETFREFYDLFELPDEQLLNLISRQLQSPNSELGFSISLFCDARLGGLVCAHDGHQMLRRQAISLRLLAAQRPITKELGHRLAHFGTKFAPIKTDSFYLCRLAITLEFRGKGLARRLLTAFEAEASRRQFKNTSLHVSIDNVAARSLYLSAGYLEISTTPHDFVAMEKSLQ